MKNNYIIITPARNESAYIEKTIAAVISQSVKPIKWVIVDDSSTDNTAEIVSKYLLDYPFIKLVKNESELTRNFGNKVYAIRRGFEEVKSIDYDYYCNLDADVSFEPTYFEYLLNKFKENPKLGICGGRLYDLVNGKFKEQKSELHSVGGPVQFFRRACYESFGGYQPFKFGFIDGFAEISARMNGWETRTYRDLEVKHYRPVGSAKGHKIKILFEGGKLEYRFGYSLFYHIIRTISRLFIKPAIIGSIAINLGYMYCLITNDKRSVNDDFIRYVRWEQKTRLKVWIINFIKGVKDGSV